MNYIASPLLYIYVSVISLPLFKDRDIFSSVNENRIVQYNIAIVKKRNNACFPYIE